MLCGTGVLGELKVNFGGLRQGSALSPLLFIAVVDLIGKKMCMNDILRKQQEKESKGFRKQKEKI